MYKAFVPLLFTVSPSPLLVIALSLNAVHVVQEVLTPVCLT